MKQILLILAFIMIPSVSFAKDIYFQGVIDNPLVEAVSEKLQNEVEAITITSDTNKTCHEIMVRGNALFKTLEKYYDGDRFILNICRVQKETYIIEYTVNRHKCSMFISSIGPSPQKVFHQ